MVGEHRKRADKKLEYVQVHQLYSDQSHTVFNVRAAEIEYKIRMWKSGLDAVGERAKGW